MLEQEAAVDLCDCMWPSCSKYDLICGQGLTLSPVVSLNNPPDLVTAILREWHRNLDNHAAKAIEV